MSASPEHGTGGPPDDHTHIFDNEQTRRNAAWYGAGVNSFGTYSFLSGLIVGPLAGFTTLIFSGDGGDAVTATVSAQLISTAVIGAYLGFRARTIVRTESVKVDPY